MALAAALVAQGAVASGAPAPPSAAGIAHGPGSGQRRGPRAPDRGLRRRGGQAQRAPRALARSTGRGRARNGLEVRGRSAPGGFLAVELEGGTVAGLRERLADDPLVGASGPSSGSSSASIPVTRLSSTTIRTRPLATSRSGTSPTPGFPRAWDFGRGQGGEVAVLDSGVCGAHPDLAASISGTLDCSGIVCVGGDVSRRGRPRDPRRRARVRGLGQRLRPRLARLRLLAVRGPDRPHLHLDHQLDLRRRRSRQRRDQHELRGRWARPAPEQALDYAWARGSVPVAAGANEATPSVGDNYPAEYVQPEGTGQNIDAGQGLVVTSAKHSGARSAFAQRHTRRLGRRLRLRHRPGLGRPAGDLLDLAAGDPRARRSTPSSRPAKPARSGQDHAVRRRPLRLPGRHLDGGAAGRRAGGADPGRAPRALGRQDRPDREAGGGRLRRVRAPGSGGGLIDADMALGAALDRRPRPRPARGCEAPGARGSG